jgi:alkanesulfonate monooxygenase SsuD/methylene tetrahydromethanopterin reductase-like flavin-dependent oxidoreductase (luciferase family)
MTSVRVGVFPLVDEASGDAKTLQATLARVADAGIDHLCVGDHVSFFVGAGSDGLITATSLLGTQTELPVYVGLYLLPLRHPVPVARQLATIAQLAPGRLTFGVGVGGEDRHEIEICGIDPKTRGRRMDECLQILRGLADGKPVTFHGEFFSLNDALIVPPPSPRVPLIVGGRSHAAVSRAARLGDGWLGIWVSHRRFAEVRDQIAHEAAAVRPDPSRLKHALNVWCGFGATRAAAREPLAAQMQRFYQMPFEPFERYSPYGTPEHIAEFLSPYIEAGCSAFNVIPCANDRKSAIAGVGKLRTLLTHVTVEPPPLDTNPRSSLAAISASAANGRECGAHANSAARPCSSRAIGHQHTNRAGASPIRSSRQT